MILRKLNRAYNHNKRYIIFGILLAVFLVGVVGMQSEYQFSGIWEADVELYKISSNEGSILRSNVDGATISSAIYDFDGEPNIATMTSMSSAGLDPTYHFTVGSFIHTDEYGTPISTAGPYEVDDIDGVRYITYYFGFSVSIVTRGTHIGMNSKVFDYYGVSMTINEIPEFAPSYVASQVGIKLVNVDNTIPTDMGVEKISKIDVEKTYTLADSLGYDANVDKFNYDYSWAQTSHKGDVSEPTFVQDYNIDDKYASKLTIGSTMTPGSEYVPKYGLFGFLIGSSFNIYDVEIIVNAMCKVVLTYEVAADVGGYLEHRLDLGGADDPYSVDIIGAIIAFFVGIIAYIASALGLDFGSAAFIFIVIIVIFLMLTGWFFRRRRMAISVVV